MKAKKRIAVLGAGGLAREVHWLLRELNRVEDQWTFAGYVVSDLARLGEHDSRDEVVGDLSWVDRRPRPVDALAIGIGTPTVRDRLGAELEARFADLEFPALIHPTAVLDRESCQVGPGVVVCQHASLTVHITLEPWCYLNLATTVGHEARIGRGAVLNPSVNISGGVTLGAGVLVGTGAKVLQYLTVHDGATVGAGAVVTRDVPAGVTVVGVPAKPRG